MSSFAALLLLAAFASNVAAQATEVVWCVPYDQPPSYANLCTKALKPANNDDVTFSCKVGLSTDGCVDMIKMGDAHLVTLDGGDMMEAAYEAEMRPLLFENYGAGVGASYFAVAAVRKEFCTADTTFADLEGTRSCHTGYRKSAGWFSPVGALLSWGVMPVVSESDTVEDDAESVASFFKTVCAPRTSGGGPLNTPDGDGDLWPQLCSGCTGDCTVNDKYYDYEGAFRCMAEDAGDVAFVKHTTIPDFALGGKSQADWAEDGPDDFMLVCPNTVGCVELDQYESCNMAKVPAHSVVTSKALAFGGDDYLSTGKAIQDALTSAVKDASFLKGTIALGGQGNFLFKTGTIGLDAVEADLQGAVGAQFIKDYDAIQAINSDEADSDR